MFKKIFGPFPDEPLLYSFDRLIGLFHKFNSKFKCKDTEAQIHTPVSVDKKIDEVTNETTTENDATDVATVAAGSEVGGASVTNENDVTRVTVMEKISMEMVETCSDTITNTSTRIATERSTVSNSKKVKRVTKLAQEPKHISAPKAILKTTSSMECNYPLSKMDIMKKFPHTNPVPSTKRANRLTKSTSTKRYTQTKGFVDSVTVVQDRFEKKQFRSDGKNCFESILKTETNRQKVQAFPNSNINRLDRCNPILNELTSRPQKSIKNIKVKDRTITKTEWAVTRIYTFDDDWQTYEVMKKDKVLDKNDEIERVFAMAPNLTTVAYNPLKLQDKKG